MICGTSSAPASDFLTLQGVMFIYSSCSAAPCARAAAAQRDTVVAFYAGTALLVKGACCNMRTALAPALRSSTAHRHPRALQVGRAEESVQTMGRSNGSPVPCVMGALAKHCEYTV